MFFTVQAEKGIAQHIGASSVVWTLINNSKLGSKIVRLVAIVVKAKIQVSFLMDFLRGEGESPPQITK